MLYLMMRTKMGSKIQLIRIRMRMRMKMMYKKTQMATKKMMKILINKQSTLLQKISSSQDLKVRHLFNLQMSKWLLRSNKTTLSWSSITNRTRIDLKPNKLSRDKLPQLKDKGSNIIRIPTLVLNYPKVLVTVPKHIHSFNNRRQNIFKISSSSNTRTTSNPKETYSLRASCAEALSPPSSTMGRRHHITM